MDEKKAINDKELKETIDKLLSDAGILLQIVSKLQDMRYEYLSKSFIPFDFTLKYEGELRELEDKLQIIDIG